MSNQVSLLILGFLLTTVLGGLLGYVFQRRAWSHQFDMQRRSTEREAASTALHELANVLDKRRYRMLLVYWRLDWTNSREFEDAVADYRAVLEEWNDGLNRRLALVATHFGAELKRELDNIYEDYREAGRLIDLAIRDRRAGRNVETRTALAELLEVLNVRNYNFAAAGLAAVLAGRVGSNLPVDERQPTPARPVLDL
ncbi:hypothetical protein [Nocardioides sediminis]|uniref:hypothetical protein n=1 Tax=Nocardioides sediminis TaxID=433648 RepID=UPI000D2FB73B|nr:hypothetical protein [Nocardioides sediminis]